MYVNPLRYRDTEVRITLKEIVVLRVEGSSPFSLPSAGSPCSNGFQRILKFSNL